MTDRRLEAIVGAPALDATTATRASLTVGGVVFVGRREATGSIQAAFQVEGAAARLANLYASGTGYVIGTAGVQRLEHADLLVGWWSAVDELGVRVKLGRSDAADQNWARPWRAVTYHHALTDTQALAVARWLSLSLSLSPKRRCTARHEWELAA